MPQQTLLLKRLCLTFDGEGLSNHEIDVDIFASSLLSLSNLIKTSHAITFDEEVNCEFKLTTVRSNCVSAEFIIACATVAGVTGTILFKIDWETALNQLLKNLGFLQSATLSLPAFFKTLRKRKIIDVEVVELEAEDVVIIHCNDETTFSMPYDLYKLIKNKHIRDNQYGLLKPLAQKGISTITYLSEVDNELVPANVVSKEELDLFLPDIIEESPEIEEFIIVGNIDRPSLQGESTGWKIIDKQDKQTKKGKKRNKTYTFDIIDEIFLSKVRNNEIPFLGSDVFRIRMRTVTPPASENKKPFHEAIEIVQIDKNQRNLFS